MPRPSAPRLLWLFARTAARRFCNRFLFGWQRARLARRKKRGLPAPEPERTATAHRHQKFRSGTLLVVLFAVYMMFVLAMAMELSVRRAINGVRMDLQPAAAQTLEEKRVDKEVEKITGMKPASRGLLEDYPLRLMTPENRPTAERAGGLLIALTALGSLLFAIGMASRNLARPEPSLAWLFEFPVPRPVLFSSRLSESLFDGATLPMLSMVPGILLWYGGLGFWAAVGWGFLFGALLALAVGALRIACEVLMLQKMKRKSRGTLGGLCAAAGTLMMVVVLYGGGTPVLQRALLAGAEALPAWFFQNPLSAGFGSGVSDLGTHWLLAAGPVAVLCVASVLLCARLTRYGLEPGLDTARGSATAPASAQKRPRFSGLIGKELAMLTRQRTVMVQVLLAPLMMVLIFYFQSGGDLAGRALSSDGALAAAIYGISSYMVLIAAQVAMNTELRTLWLLLSLPRALADALRVKSRIWGAAAAVLVLILSATAMLTQPQMAGGLLLRLPFILVLVWLIADLTVGIRTAGSCVISETTVQMKQWANWMPLLLSAGAGQAVFAGNLWALTVQVVLLAALNVSVWQKLETDLPYLTEPAEDPPARLCLMHGQFAVYGYFVLQSLAIVVLARSGVPFAVSLPVGAAAAALLIAVIAVTSLRRHGIRILPEPAPFRASGALLTAGTLAAACGAGFLWLKFAPHFPWAAEQLKLMAEQTEHFGNSYRIGLAAAAVIVAPLCEEFLFRGIVYQGLRKSCGVRASVLWSALFFTVVHPAISAPAVFVVAVGLALVMEHTRRIWPCIFIHAAYNAFMLWLQWR